jgi:general secretion pathway protein G
MGQTACDPPNVLPVRGFTLIELLVVVAIIAILAAIAVPNFLEAQTRAKIARVRADMRSLATGIETYRVDDSSYPPPFGVSVGGRDSWAVLSTPVAYLTDPSIDDPFVYNLHPPKSKRLIYEAVNRRNQMIETPPSPPQSVGPEGQRVIWWWIASRGPDGSLGFRPSDPEAPLVLKFYEADINPDGWLSVVYDPTNGTTSLGNIYRAGGQFHGFAGQTMNR